jgi:hypothetical protein
MVFIFIKNIFYYVDKRENLKQKVLIYKNQKDDKKDQSQENDDKKKKNRKETKVKEIYSKPSDAIQKIIPFCSKKYTVQKNDA